MHALIEGPAWDMYVVYNHRAAWWFSRRQGVDGGRTKSLASAIEDFSARAEEAGCDGRNPRNSSVRKIRATTSGAVVVQKTALGSSVGDSCRQSELVLGELYSGHSPESEFELAGWMVDPDGSLQVGR